MCLVPARNGDRIARDDRDGRKALAEHIPRNDYSEPKITYLKDTGKGLDRSAMTHGNSVRKSLENIEDQEVINKLLLHLGLWRPHQRPPPKPKSLEGPLLSPHLWPYFLLDSVFPLFYTPSI